MNHYLSLTILFILITLQSFGQVSYGGAPYTMSHHQKNTNSKIVIQTATKSFDKVNNEALKKEAKALSESDGIDYTGRLIDADINVLQMAEKSQVEGKFTLYKLRLVSEDALEVNLLFDKFKLPKGSQLFFYDDSMTQIIGSYNEKNNHQSNTFTTPVIKGSSINIEYLEPLEAKNKTELNIFKIVHGFKSVQSKAATNDSGSCNIDINCEEGANWQAEKKGVVKIHIYSPTSFKGVASGSLINSTAFIRKPLVLTAKHALPMNGQIDFSFWLNYCQFEFHFEASGCDGSDNAADNHIIEGAKLVSQSSVADMALLELSGSIPDFYNVTYNGWNATNSSPSSFTGIHHPQGDLKKIATGNTQLSTIYAQFGNDPSNPNSSGAIHDETTLGNQSPNTDFKLNWDEGITEEGSSGSPLFDQNHLIVGQLRGGTSACPSTNGPDYYGRLYIAWENPDNILNPDTGEQLEDLQSVLDQGNTGATILNSYATSSGLNAQIQYCNNAGFSNCNNDFSENQDIFFKANIGGGLAPYSYSWDFGDGFSENGSGITSHSYFDPGIYSVSVTVTDASGETAIAYSSVFVGSNTPYINVDFTISDTYVQSGDPPVVFTNNSTSNINIEGASFYWDFGKGASPRYAYSEGPHEVCYDDNMPNKTVRLEISESNTGAFGFSEKTLTVVDDISTACSPPSGWITTPGANVVAAQPNCYFPESVGIRNGNLSIYNCDVDSGISSEAKECGFDLANLCFNDTWYMSHGTVDVGDFSDQPYEGYNQSASFRIGSWGYINVNDEPKVSSEGIIYQHPTNFRYGETYRFFFHARAYRYGYAANSQLQTMDQLYISLAKDLVGTNDCENIGENYRLPDYSFEFYELGNFNKSITESWSCYVVTFTAPSDDFDQIWIYPWMDEAALTKNDVRTGFILMDNFSLATYNENCATDIVIMENDDITSLEASGTITSEGTVTIPATENITYSAGNSITLTPGFSVASGAEFQAVIAPCGTLGGKASPSNFKFGKGHKTTTRSSISEPLPQDYKAKNIITDKSVLIYPNPAKDQLHITLPPEKELLNVVVYNVQGEQVTTGKSTTVSVAALAAGVYFVEIQLADGEHIARKIIISRN